MLVGRTKLVSPLTRGLRSRPCEVMRSLHADRRGTMRCRHPRLSIDSTQNATEKGSPSRAVSHRGQPPGGPSNRKRTHCSERQSTDGAGRKVEHSRRDWPHRVSGRADAGSCLRGAQLPQPLLEPDSATGRASRMPNEEPARRACEEKIVRAPGCRPREIQTDTVAQGQER